jgi:hypothetical protein
MERLKPTLHHDYQINDRVWFTLEEGGPKHRGYIGGVGFTHVIFGYLIVLDEPIEVPGWTAPWTVVSVPGGMLHIDEDPPCKKCNSPSGEQMKLKGLRCNHRNQCSVCSVGREYCYHSSKKERE